MTIHLDPKTEAAFEKKLTARDRKRRLKMKVSGASVKKLQRIIIQRGKN
ncbi:MAG: hypothetical protein WCT27_02580 [Patescibacteria group bacterium]|jgi:hypothetical protein